MTGSPAMMARDLAPIIPTEPQPSILVKGSRWAKAVAKWIAEGKPVRTDEEVLQIVAICTENSCGQFTGTACKACGCRINKGEWAVLNKARMKTEVCPKGLWN